MHMAETCAATLKGRQVYRYSKEHRNIQRQRSIVYLGCSLCCFTVFLCCSMLGCCVSILSVFFTCCLSPTVSLYTCNLSAQTSHIPSAAPRMPRTFLFLCVTPQPSYLECQPATISSLSVKSMESIINLITKQIRPEDIF